MNKRVYLDYAAATPLDSRVKKAMDEYLSRGGANPSGLHQEGREARKILEDSRKIVAESVGAKAGEIIFTSSTTESNNLAILGVARANQKHGRHLVTTAAEHVSVLNPFKKLEHEGFEVTYVNVDEYGRVGSDQIKAALRPDTVLVSVIYASNEIGSINPIREIGNGINGLKGKSGLPLFFSDAAQAFPHQRINVANAGLDLMSFASSKIYGPKGAAALYVKAGVKIEPILFGGSQENSLRPGTQDMAGIVGFAKAVQIIHLEGKGEDEKLSVWRDKIIAEVRSAVPETLLNGHSQERLANNVSFSIPGVKAEELVLVMDEAGFALSTRSACDAKNPTPPHVIKAIGRSDNEAWGTVRVTLGRYTMAEDVDSFIETFVKEIKKLKNRV